jgi:hypothetical protein
MREHDLEADATGIIAELICESEHLDIYNVENGIWERINRSAEISVIYHSDALQLIRDYDSERSGDLDETGLTYSADRWREAANEYAYLLACDVLLQKTSRVFEDLKEEAQEIFEMSELDGADLSDIDDLIVSRECPGVGFHSRKVAGAWLSYALPENNPEAIA